MEEKEFERLLKICRLSLNEKEMVAIKKDLGAIIEYFDAIEKVDVDDASPAYHPIKVEGQLRQDIVKECENPDSLLKGTKSHRFYVIGPKV